MFCRKAVGAVCFAMMLTAVAAPKRLRAQSPCALAGDSEVTGSCGRL